MFIDPREITEIKKRIENFSPAMNVTEIGTVVQVGDGIVRIEGLPGAMNGELLEMSCGMQAMPSLTPTIEPLPVTTC